jgi:glycosyltransferase involved in cell wall biosynthesis
MALGLAHRITVCSDYQSALAGRYGVSSRLIPLGVDCAIFRPSPMADGPPWRLLHVASLNPVKDQTTLLRAFQTLMRQRLDARLDIVGEDTLGGALTALARHLSIDQHVTFHGFLPTEDLVSFYQRSHLFVLSSRHEAAGAAVLEAAATGLPIVGTSVGYVSDWAGDRALAVPPRDPDALADAIRSLIADRAHRARLSAAARQWALAHDVEWTALALEKLYDELVTPGS